MLDVDTFLTTLYVTVDDFCQSRAPKRKPGPEASLSASEVITLSIFARWSRFASERDFYRAMPRLTCATLSLPCPTARSSTASCVSTQNSSKPSCCIWRLFCGRESALTTLLTRHWTARRCRG
jgi:hypothetical protein